MQRILQSYLKRLANLSSNNRSLYLPRLHQRQHLDLHDTDFLNNFASFKLIEWLIADGQHDLESIPAGKLPLGPKADSRHQASAAVSRRLQQIVRTDQFLFDEQGTRDLYVGWPFIRGQFQDGTLVRCPLIFFPVTLQLDKMGDLGQQWVISLREEGAAAFNKSFLLSYAFRHEQAYNEGLAERSFDDLDHDSRIFRTSLYQIFKESDIELNFNQEIFVDQLSPFREFTKQSFLEETDPGILKLYPEAVLGIFPQAGSYLVPDYQMLMDRQHIPDIEAFFSRRAHADQDRLNEVQQTVATEDSPSEMEVYRYAQRVKEEQIYTPYQLDAYQEQVLKQVKRGNSIVVQGPPGTGKSQLITNLVSDFIAQGKRVLVVCQKRAALDVVYQRLREKDVHPFAALVHDFKNDRSAIYDQIKKQVEALYEYQLKNNNLDSIYLERQFLQASRQIEQICEELDEFKEALYDEAEAGVSVKELYLTSHIDWEVFNVKQEYRYLRVPELPQFLKKLHVYITNYLEYDVEHYTYVHRKPFLGYKVEDLQQLKQYLKEIPAYKAQLVEQVNEVLKTDIDFVTCENIQHRSEDIEFFLKLLEAPESYEYFQSIIGKIDKDADPLWLANIERIVMECYEGNGVEVSLNGMDLGKFQQLLQRAEESRSGLLKWVSWQTASKEKQWLAEVFEANQLELTKEGFMVMSERLDNRLNLEHNLTKLRERIWTEKVPDWDTSNQYEKAEMERWFTFQKQALQAALLFKNFRNFNEYFGINSLEYAELKTRIERMLVLVKDIPQYQKKWQKYLTPAQVSQLNEPEHGEHFIEVLDRDFEALVAFDTLKADLLSHEKSILERVVDEMEPLNADESVRRVENSLRLAWIDHIETKFPVLRIVSSSRIQELEKDLQQAIADKQEVSQEILLMKLRERTYYDVEYNRLNNLVTYRDVNHQVTKKRKIWPLRKVISTFHNELFNLIPCWLASPETVSAIFPMEETPLFDLVIFDEASQCFAEKGIPAMYRGQQIVVVGDEQQLQPNDLYQVRWEEETPDDEVENALALEVDSLLDLAKGYLPIYRLEEHYRSKSLELIDFSNERFYQNRLRMLPQREDLEKKDPAIHYIKVDGIWANQVNEPEAEKVLKLIQELHQQVPEKSIGIITFNAKQQDLIRDRVEQAILNDANGKEPKFIKNIENVQGDECDIIIFSMAYAPNEQGKVVLQFGSLNAAGGENRLNVAVTRARERIYVVTSLLPEQLNVENTKNQGPKMLKEYLEYAYGVSKGQYRTALPELSDHHAEWFLHKHLQSWAKEDSPDMDLEKKLPFADLTITEELPERTHYVGLLNTDDDLYFQSPSAKEAHAYRHYLYQEKNWKFKNIYSRQYWQNARHVQEEINRFVQTRGERK
uniref:AAA domain-containing protein n=1 Tax=Roseihalotalea indica TaxID=2867963 RepID=A0AA49JFY4_9BACT|nr:AAA domain-containing protein [Tunicatimonas sp. TK19036]